MSNPDCGDRRGRYRFAQSHPLKALESVQKGPTSLGASPQHLRAAYRSELAIARDQLGAKGSSGSQPKGVGHRQRERLTKLAPVATRINSTLSTEPS